MVENNMHKVVAELEMQRRALVSLKAQRDLDRHRRLQLIKRLKKYKKQQDQFNLHLKCIVSLSVLVSILLLLK